MVFVHPSRMALVPQDSEPVRSSRSRLPSPPHSRPSSTNRARDRSLDRNRVRSRDEEYDRERGRGGRRGRSRDYRDGERQRDRARSRSSDHDVHREPNRQSQSQSHHRSNGDRYDSRRDDHAGDSDSRGARARRDDRSSARSPPPPPPPSSSKPPPGRASPSYDDYSRRDPIPLPLPHDDRSRRPDTPPVNEPPSRQQENMYRRDGRYDGGGDYFERRRQQRINNTFNIWPPSPRAPARDFSLERDKESRSKHKRDRSTSVSSTDSEEERRHRKKKERKRARKERDRRGRRHRRSRSYSSDEPRERHRDSKQKRSRSTSRELRKTRSGTQSPRHARSSDEDEWVEKSAPSGSFIPAVPTTMPIPTVPSPSTARFAQKRAIDGDGDGDSSDDGVGPQPAAAPLAKKIDERAYGGALLRGEGSAMAAFLQDGTDVRIPRRGEIGLTSNEIDTFEAVGYVMSGSRHRRMNAVRMRKENQVISAEEKRGILKLQQEEKQRREAILREEFQELLTDRLKGAEGGKAS